MPDTNTFRVIKSGAYGRMATDRVENAGPTPAVIVAANENDYRTMWGRYIDDDPAPQIDFNRESVIFLVLGLRSKGGHAVTAQEVSVRDGLAKVVAPVTVPGSDQIVTMAITAPYAVIAVPQRNLAGAEWHDAGRVLARTERPAR